MDISASIDRAVGNYFTHWLSAHPYLVWLGVHPLWSLGLGLLTILSVWGLIRAIGRGVEQIWLLLLTTPFKLLQPIFGRIWSGVRRLFGHTKSSGDRLDSQLISSSPTERVATIVDRLHSLSHEQQLLLQELATLTGSPTAGTSIDNISDTQYKNMSAKLLKLH
ncbi:MULTISPECIES: hypothetical protein [unclassified Chamaesiphon]|uniref:hypothetical protein n=1 Tax=unclassified Chamaesiphon TaxID=2620921 RepID=UPI00286A7B43|nr:MULTISPECIES: hypothetical protein [unclassified Chamaesiphon]